MPGSVYLEILGAATVTDLCGPITRSATSSIVPIPEGRLSTISSDVPLGRTYESMEMWSSVTKALNPTDIACPTWGVSTSLSTSYRDCSNAAEIAIGLTCTAPHESTIHTLTVVGPPFNPIIVPPSELLSLDPAWARCPLIGDSWAIYDPPRILSATSAILAPTTSISSSLLSTQSVKSESSAKPADTRSPNLPIMTSTMASPSILPAKPEVPPLNDPTQPTVPNPIVVSALSQSTASTRLASSVDAPMIKPSPSLAQDTQEIPVLTLVQTESGIVPFPRGSRSSIAVIETFVVESKPFSRMTAYSPQISGDVGGTTYSSLGGISSAPTTGNAINLGQKFTVDGLVGELYRGGSTSKVLPSNPMLDGTTNSLQNFGSIVTSYSKGEDLKTAVSPFILVSGQPEPTEGGVFVLLSSTLVSSDASPIVVGSKTMEVSPGMSIIADQTVAALHTIAGSTVMANSFGGGSVTNTIIGYDSSGEPIVKSNVDSDISTITLNGQATVASISGSLATAVAPDGTTIVLPVVILATGPSTLNVKAQTTTIIKTATSMTNSTITTSANFTTSHTSAPHNVSSDVPGITSGTTALPTSNRNQASEGSIISSLTTTAVLSVLMIFYLVYI